MRKLLSSAPILAHPRDYDAIQREENNDLFVLQLPTDLLSNLDGLILRKNDHNNDNGSSDTNNDNGSSSNGINKNRIGKLQLMRSGDDSLL